MKTKLIAVLALGLSVTAQAANAANIKFWYGNAGRIEKAIQNACEGFNASQNTHSISCIGQGSYEAGMQKAIAAYRTQEHPVLIQFFDAGTLDLMLSGAVVPVEDIIPNANWNDYIRGARSYYETSKGELFSQPYNGSTLVFYANMDMLGKVGVTEIPQTYKKVIEVARKLKENGHACPVLQRVHPWFSLEQLSARHGEAVASKGNGYGGIDAEYTFNKGLVSQHLTNIAAWRAEGLFQLPADVSAGKNGFVSGECAMIESSTAGYGNAYNALGDAVAVGLAPVYESYKRHNTLIGGASVWAMKGHDDESYAAARAFLNFIRQPAQQIEFTRRTGNAPVTHEALNVLQASDKADDIEFATANLSVKTLNQPGNENSRGIRLGFYVQFRDIYIEEVTKAFNGEQNIQSALDHAKRRGDELLRRFEQTYKGVKLP